MPTFTSSDTTNITGRLVRIFLNQKICGTEFFTAWYSGNKYEQFVFINRAFGPYAWAYWTMVTCNVLVPQIFW